MHAHSHCVILLLPYIRIIRQLSILEPVYVLNKTNSRFVKVFLSFFAF